MNEKKIRELCAKLDAIEAEMRGNEMAVKSVRMALYAEFRPTSVSQPSPEAAKEPQDR